MSTSANKVSGGARRVIQYTCVTLFCLLFFLLYDQFSHDVHSPYMTNLFAWPLVLGLLPELVFLLLPTLRQPGTWAKNLYHAGVAALTVSSTLRGIFDIAGTASDYQEYLLLVGAVLWLGGIFAYCNKR